MKKRAPFQVRNASGFVLIEVLVGMAILSIAMMAAMRAIANGADTQLAISQRTMALWSADNALLDLRIMRTWPEFGAAAYACPQANQAFVCQRKVLPTPNPAFRRVEVAVYLSDPSNPLQASGPRLAWLTTVVPNPNGGVL